MKAIRWIVEGAISNECEWENVTEISLYSGGYHHPMRNGREISPAKYAWAGKCEFKSTTAHILAIFN